MTEPTQGEPPHEMDDHRLEMIIGRLLQVGVGVAVAIVVCGGGAPYLIAHRNDPFDRTVFVGEPPELESLSGIVGLAMQVIPAGLFSSVFSC